MKKSRGSIVHCAQYLRYGSGKGLCAIIEKQLSWGMDIHLILAEEIEEFHHDLEMLKLMDKFGVCVDFVDSTFKRTSASLENLKNILIEKRSKVDAVFVSHGGFSALALTELKFPYVHVCHGLGLNRPAWVDEQDISGIGGAYKVFAASEEVGKQVSKLVPCDWSPLYYPLEVKKIRGFSGFKTPLRLGVVGALVPLKGQRFAIDALQELDFPAELHLFGDGESREELELLVKKQRLEQRVFFHGFVAAEEAYRTLDILLMPSLKEGLGMVGLEAMERGIPVCAFDTGGIGELILPGKCGLLSAAENVGMLVSNIRRYYEDEELARAHLDAGISHAKELFSAERNLAPLRLAVEEMIHSDIGVKIHH
jgi:glycosyltransferase involved in cell wall biosynthesis